jgi:hypothetical protein
MEGSEGSIGLSDCSGYLNLLTIFEIIDRDVNSDGTVSPMVDCCDMRESWGAAITHD